MLLKEIVLEQSDNEYQRLIKWAEENKDVFPVITNSIISGNIRSPNELRFETFDDFVKHFVSLKHNIEYEHNYKGNLPIIDYDKIIKEAKKILGIGQQAVAYDKSTSNDIGQIVKLLYLTSPFEKSNDTYVKFLKYFMRRNNPYFPKVYGLKEYINSETDVEPFEEYACFKNECEFPYVVYMEMEKLYKLRDEHIKEAVVEKMKTLGFPEPEMKDNRIYIDGTYIYSYFQNVGNIKRIIENTNDDNLKEALSYIVKEMENPDFGSSTMTDMHMGNIMVRLTSVGPQLVFIDPFV